MLWRLSERDCAEVLFREAVRSERGQSVPTIRTNSNCFRNGVDCGELR